MGGTVVSVPVLIALLDSLGLVVFAVSGALQAIRRGLDLFGVLTIGTVTAIGGGTLRDLLLGQPAAWIADPAPLALAALGVALAVILRRRIASDERWLLWADAVGLATFACLGCSKAAALGAPAPVAVLMGVITAGFGGVLRDILCAEVPMLLRKEVYATAAALGAAAFLVADRGFGWGDAALVLGIGSAFALRAAGLYFGLSLPQMQKK